MKFRNYCIIIMGDTKNVLEEIIKISETSPNVLDAKGVMIATFTSVAEPKELNDYFKSNNRNFLFFDLNKEHSGYHINKNEINQALFGFLKDNDEEALKQKTDSLLNELTSTTSNNTSVLVKKKKENKISLKDIDKMSDEDKLNLIDKIIDKGVDNLTPYDKKLLKKLSN